jgi:hypothetical protein
MFCNRNFDLVFLRTVERLIHFVHFAKTRQVYQFSSQVLRSLEKIFSCSTRSESHSSPFHSNIKIFCRREACRVQKISLVQSLGCARPPQKSRVLRQEVGLVSQKITFCHDCYSESQKRLFSFAYSGQEGDGSRQRRNDHTSRTFSESKADSNQCDQR